MGLIKNFKNYTFNFQYLFGDLGDLSNQLVCHTLYQIYWLRFLRNNQRTANNFVFDLNNQFKILYNFSFLSIKKKFSIKLYYIILIVNQTVNNLKNYYIKGILDLIFCKSYFIYY